MNRLLFLTSCLILALAAPVLGAENPLEDGRLSAVEAYQWALDRNPQLQGVRLQEDRMAASRRGALGWEAPELSYLREGMASDLPAPGEERWTITQELPSLLSGLKRRSGYGAYLEAARLEEQDARRRLRSRVKVLYVEVVHRQKVVDLLADQITLSRQAHQAVTLKEELGEASKRERLQSQLNNAALKQDLLVAQAEFDQARYALFEVMGLTPDEQEYGVEFTDPLVFNDVDYTQDESLGELGVQPRYLAAAAQRHAAESLLAAEQWTLFPDLSVSLYQQNYEGEGFDHHGFEVAARLPLWFMPARQGRLGEAKAEAALGRWRQEAVLLEMKREIEQAWHGYETSLSIIRQLTGESLEQSTELLNLTLEGYREGEVGLLDLIAAQQTYTASQRRYQDALFDYYQRLITLETYLPGELIMAVETAAPEPENQGAGK